MVISIMANVSFVAPYTFYIIPGQALVSTECRVSTEPGSAPVF